MYLYTAVAQFGQFAQESYVSTWYNMSILKPIVENIAQKDEAFGIVFDAVEPGNYTLLACVRVEITCTQVKVGYEICFVALAHAMCGMGLEKTEVQFCLLAHHVLVPLRFKYELYVGTFYALDTLYFHAYVFDDEVGCRTVGCGESHINVCCCTFYIYLVDETEVVYIYRYFGVEYRTKHLYNLFLKFYFVAHVLCYN